MRTFLVLFKTILVLLIVIACTLISNNESSGIDRQMSGLENLSDLNDYDVYTKEIIRKQTGEIISSSEWVYEGREVKNDSREVYYLEIDCETFTQPGPSLGSGDITVVGCTLVKYARVCPKYYVWRRQIWIEKYTDKLLVTTPWVKTSTFTTCSPPVLGPHCGKRSNSYAFIYEVICVTKAGVAPTLCPTLLPYIYKP